MEKLLSFLTSEKGATAVEYAIMVSAIAAVIIAIVYVIGGKVKNEFGSVNSSWN